MDETTLSTINNPRGKRVLMKCHPTCLGISGTLVIILFLALGLCSYIASRVTYERHVAEDYYYDTGLVFSVEISHWMALVAGISVGVSLLYGIKYDLCAGIAIISCGSCLGMAYIAHIAVFLAALGYLHALPTMDVADALELRDKALAMNPAYSLRMQVVNWDGNISCKTGSIDFEVIGSLNSRVVDTVSDLDLIRVSALRIATSVVVSLEPESLDLYKNTTAAAARCPQLDRGRYADDVPDRYLPGIPSDFIITANGKPPALISKGYAVVAGILLQGAVYAYRVEAMPTIFWRFWKSNVTLAPYELDAICDDLGKCR